MKIPDKSDNHWSSGLSAVARKLWRDKLDLWISGLIYPLPFSPSWLRFNSLGLKVTPREKYGDDFLCKPFTLKKADGSIIHAYDICVCIAPKQDEATTLVYAWDVFREIAQWVCTEFESHPPSETYRVVVGWSRSVRERQGHIVKIWRDLAGVREAANYATVDDCAARFGSSWLPFENWQKDVFKRIG